MINSNARKIILVILLFYFIYMTITCLFTSPVESLFWGIITLFYFNILVLAI